MAAPFDVDLSCLDWEQRIREGRSLLPGVPLDQERVDAALAIFNALQLPDVPGTPLLADAAGEWMRDVVRALFGGFADGQRFIREVGALVPKKNAKTTGGAAIMVTALMMNRRPRAEFLLIAPTQEITDLAYAQAVGMVQADPVLARKFKIRDHLKKITFWETGAFLKVKSFDPKVVTGTKPAGILMDELHVIAEAPDADRVIGQLRGGLVSQPEAFLLFITTQSERQPSGVFLSELQKWRKVRDGQSKAPVLPLLYEFPRGVDWKDPANWPMVLPNAGRSITVARLVEDYEQAKDAGEGELRRWASQHLNVEIGVAMMEWAGAEFWERQTFRHALSLRDLMQRCEVCTAGIDGGGLDDLLALCVLGRERGTGHWLAWNKTWVHPVALERRRNIAARLRDFAAAGELVISEAVGPDMTDLIATVKILRDAGLLPEKAGVGIDPANSHAAVNGLSQEGFTDEEVAAVSQGWRLNAAIKLVERLLAEGTLWHADQAITAWAVGNAKVEARGNAILITKAAAGFAKIDPLMALFNAAELMARNPVAAGRRSFWEAA